MFHNVDTMAEKAHLLGLTKYSSLADGTCSMHFLPDLMGHTDVTRERQDLRLPGPIHAMNGFKH